MRIVKYNSSAAPAAVMPTSPQDATDEHREGVGKDDAKPEDQPVKTQYWGINIYFSSFGGK